MKAIYLDSERKQRYMSELQSSDTVIDKEIREYIVAINRLPFVCTTQCCAGHPDYGYISLMVTEDKAQWFEEEVVVPLAARGFDVFKRYEKIDEVVIRYIFWFEERTRQQFFDILFDCLGLRYD